MGQEETICLIRSIPGCFVDGFFVALSFIGLLCLFIILIKNLQKKRKLNLLGWKQNDNKRRYR